jgi:hypothetical protein
VFPEGRLVATDHDGEGVHPRCQPGQPRSVAEARATVRRLEEEKRDLEERLAFLARELERTRMKLTGGMRTS